MYIWYKNVHSILVKQVLLLVLFCKWGTERLSDVPEVTQLERANLGSRLWICAFLQSVPLHYNREAEIWEVLQQ